MGYGKIVFVRPPNLKKSGEWLKQGVIRPPLNLAMFISYLQQQGDFDCSLVDFETIPEADPKRMAEIVLKQDPRYVCITTLTPRYPIIVKMAQALKKLNPSISVVVGGAHVTGAPQASLFDGIDYAVVGEGEETLLELVKVLDAGKDPRGIRNLVFRENDQVVVNKRRPFIKDLDALPFPAYEHLDMDKYVDPLYFKAPHTALFAGRGCPYNCNFCASAVTWKRKVRFRSPENIIAELKFIVERLGIRNLMFWDDTFGINTDQAIAICQGICEEKLNLNYMIQLRADNTSEELVHWLKKSGCRLAAIGVETGNEHILRHVVGKKANKAQIRQAVKILKSQQIEIIASYILGHPGDTHETIRETLDFAFELDCEQSKFMILTPYPGTPVYELALARGLADPKDMAQLADSTYFDNVAINLSEVSNEDLIKYQDEAYDWLDRRAAERKQATQ